MNKVMALAVVVALLFLTFVTGMATIYFGGPGAKYFESAFFDLTRLRGEIQYGYFPNKAELLKGALPVSQEDWRNPPAPDVEPGLQYIAKNKVQPGLTVYTPVYPWKPIRLIDEWGNTIHSWSLSKTLDFGPRLDDVEFPRAINPAITDIHVYPDGGLLAVMGHDLGYQPYGYGLAKLNAKSELEWAYMKQTHHQLDVAIDGRIAVILNREITEPWPGLEKIEVPFLDEEVAILSPDGDELNRISVLEAFLGTPWESVLQFVDPETWDGDIFHANAAKFLTPEQAKAIPDVRGGSVLLSLRNINVLAVLDLEERKIVWAVRGPWHMQHDPQVLANGNILLFDNRGDLAKGGRSRVIEFVPQTMRIAWEWPGRYAEFFDAPSVEAYSLYTSVCGAVSRLENGNTLIAETNRGRLLEVNPKGFIVWEYYVPERVTTKAGFEATKVWHPQRIRAEQLEFLGDRLALGSAQP